MDDMIYGRLVQAQLAQHLKEVYLIRRKDHVNPHFFLLDWSDDYQEYVLTRWTPSKIKAYKFPTEEAVETFKSIHIRTDQPCEIIRI